MYDGFINAAKEVFGKKVRIVVDWTLDKKRRSQKIIVRSRTVEVESKPQRRANDETLYFEKIASNR